MYDTKGRKVKESVETLSEQSGFDQFTDGGQPVNRPDSEADTVLKHDMPDWDTVLDELHEQYARLDYIQRNGDGDDELEEVEDSLDEIVAEHPNYQLTTHMY